MDKDRNEMSRRILDFTLEIIYLLSGEEYTIVKKTSGDCTTPIIHESGGWSSSQCPITEPPPHSRIHEKKILELIYKMTELLTGEVPIRCQDVTVYFSMEEWEYLEGHKHLYEEVMMENYRPRTSQDGSSRRNPPERCPSPLYSQDSPEENQNVPGNPLCKSLVSESCLPFVPGLCRPMGPDDYTSVPSVICAKSTKSPVQELLS
ncbi:oocyte zinc finger protein XlCOF7.1-like [Rhinoderma darwinii]|uniref:oocyte zinc finger protein XlCOF7.1-like n=1 Tax=Rhinoderma darwinii TaxID=43563 RepID=UPI003F670F0A